MPFARRTVPSVTSPSAVERCGELVLGVFVRGLAAPGGEYLVCIVVMIVAAAAVTVVVVMMVLVVMIVMMLVLLVVVLIMVMVMVMMLVMRLVRDLLEHLGNQISGCPPWSRAAARRSDPSTES